MKQRSLFEKNRLIFALRPSQLDVRLN